MIRPLMIAAIVIARAAWVLLQVIVVLIGRK